MINLENIHSLTDFKRNAKDYVEQLKEAKAPLVLTINGEAALVVHEAHVFQEMMNRHRHTEEELHNLKLEMLRHEINIGVEQIEKGECTMYNTESLPTFAKQIKARARHKKSLQDSSI
jgi:PHD/YefM family antitoxin component YafN of YafNO toxin-antitoxin module